MAASLAGHKGVDSGHGAGALDAQGGGAAAVAIAGLAASVQQKAGLVDGSKRVASNPRKEWSATEDELIRNGVAQMGYKWRVIGDPNPNPNLLTLTRTRTRTRTRTLTRRVIAAQLPGRSDDAVPPSPSPNSSSPCFWLK